MKRLSWLKALFSQQNSFQQYDPKDWENLADFFAPDDNSLSKEIILAITNPIEYDEQFPNRLINRGMKSIEGVPLIALIDGLLQRNLALGLDWKASMEEFQEEAIRVMEDKIQDTQWLRVPNDSPSEAFTEHLEQVKKTFNAAGYTIICLDNDSDEYNLIIVALTDFGDAQAKLLSAKCKFLTLDEMILES